MSAPIASLTLTTEQIELQDSLKRFFAEHLTSVYLRERIEKNAATDPALCEKLRALGLQEFFADHAHGAGIRDLGLIAFEAGFALLPENLVDELLSLVLLRRLATSRSGVALAKALGISTFAALAGGTTPVAMWNGSGPALRGTKRGSSLRVSGELTLATGAENGSWILAPVAQGKKTQLGLISLRGGTIRPEPVLDGTLKRSRMVFKNAECVATGLRTDDVVPLIYILRTLESAGACARAVAMTVQHVSTRVQFDAPVGSFQAVQQRLADMHLKSEALKALGNFAAWAADASPEQLVLAASSAITLMADEAARVIEGAIQLHGGIGFTWEYDLHLYLRRVKSYEALYRPGEELLSALIEAAM